MAACNGFIVVIALIFPNEIFIHALQTLYHNNRSFSTIYTASTTRVFEGLCTNSIVILCLLINCLEYLNKQAISVSRPVLFRKNTFRKNTIRA